ncbi:MULTISPECIES: FecR domain-containing protein [Gammaproteobacteria]|uniref:FecR domain-containing protein n=1 Tax=Gammaproteobacteria TaxID=1236 RepID=UPI0019123213|nr:FecR domain-containing protein [Bacillus sp. TH86]MBK5309387.1 FecR domain-containing protein [Pseudomonas sp. TH71]MBK5314848.1 FecR domain-containing protein [Erwinia sp. TH79]MBK5320349.1 FecR domain-containing protein [Bacillus sp. TH59]MBK5335299.1 FecR domain-containing protein [Bacillus sp. TH57]MBK5368591.1 FecR domain-containing protein [Pseudomonas sp. TH40]MBK5379760.1 FecR domain-containing protein [Pseudomonas sp. TH35]MBK5385219.1 FecR domain-containing protein [Pseudomonas 
MNSPVADARQAVRAAAQWLALLESGNANEQDRANLQRWRDSCVSHEQAWQKAQALRQRFASLPSALALKSLDRPEPGRRVVLKRALSAVALVPGAWLISRQLPLDVWRADLHTATGERKQLQLADGSSLQLNTASAVDVDLQSRRLKLIEGELSLKVPSASPLTIQSKFGQIIVSQSEVCVRQEARGCRVSVYSGAVQLQPLQGPVLALRGGQQVSLQAAGVGPISPFDVLAPGWREGVLMAKNQPLGDFLRELSTYRPGVLRWEPELEALRVTGSFRLDDTDRVLALLAASLPLEVHSRTRYWVTLLPRKNSV